MRTANKNLFGTAVISLICLAGASCIRRAPAGLLDPRTALTNTLTSTPTLTFTTVPSTNTFTPVPPTNTFTAIPSTNTFTNTPVPPTNTPTITFTPPPGATNTFTPTPLPPTNTFTLTPIPPTNTFTSTPVPPTNTFTHTLTPLPTSTFTPTTGAALPYIIRGEAGFAWNVSPASWATSAYPNSEMVRGAPPYSSWTAATASDAVMYGGFNGNAGTGPTWCTPLTTFTTFQVNQDLTDKIAGAGSLRFSGQQGGYTWGGWTYWGLTINGSWSVVGLAPFLTGLEFWAKDLQPDGHSSSIRLGLRGTDVDDGTGGTDWAKDQALSGSWTQYQHDFLTMDSGYPSFTPITNFTATGPTIYAGLAGSGAGAACTWAYLLDEVKLY